MSSPPPPPPLLRRFPLPDPDKELLDESSNGDYPALDGINGEFADHHRPCMPDSEQCIPDFKVGHAFRLVSEAT